VQKQTLLSFTVCFFLRKQTSFFRIKLISETMSRFKIKNREEDRLRALRKVCFEYLSLRGRTWQEAGAYCIIKSFIICAFMKMLRQIKNYKMGRTCKLVRMENMRWNGQKSLVEILENTQRNGKLSVNIKMAYLKETGREDVDWNHLSQDRDLWWPLVNMVMNTEVS
jgi:hypothetical protein